MPKVQIKVGGRADNVRELREATDEWVWMRIHEERSVHLEPPFAVQVRLGELQLELCTPLSGECPVESKTDHAFEREIVDIWKRMGLHCADYTAGAAVSFVRHLRVLVDGQLQKKMWL